MADHRYVVEVHLVTGAVVRGEASEDHADNLLAQMSFVRAARDDANNRRISALFTYVAKGREDTEALFELQDAEGRYWGIPGRSIAAFNVTDRNAAQSPHGVGFAWRPTSDAK